MAEQSVEVAISAVTDAAQDSLDDVEGSLEGVGEAGDAASGGIDDASESLFELDSAGVAAGAGLAGVGAAIEGINKSTQDWRESLGRTSVSLGLTQSETEDMAAAISNATFPMDDAVATMDELAQQGIKTEDEMKNVAAVMDNIADATDSSAESIAQNVGPALSAFGQDLEDAEEHMDTFTFVARNTTLDVEEFAGSVERLAPELQEMGLSLDETAQFMAALEEKGITGRAALREMRQAANEAEGDQQAFADALGVTEDELAAQEQALNDAQGSTDEFAQQANESITTTDRLGAAFDDVKLQLGGLLGPIDAAGPALMGLGGALTAVSTINFSAVVPSLVAVWGALAPLLPILIPLVAIVGALGAAWKGNFLGIRDVTGQAMSAVQERLGVAIDRIMAFKDSVMESLQPVIDLFKNQFIQTIQVWAGVLQDLMSVVSDAWGEHGDTVIAIVEPFLEYLELVVTVFADAVLSILSAFFAVMRGDFDEAMTIITDMVDRNLDRVMKFFSDMGRDVLKTVDRLVQKTIEAFLGLFDRLIGNSIIPEMLTAIIQAFLDWRGDVIDAITDAVNAAVDRFMSFSSDFRQAGRDLLSGFVSGVRDRISDIKDAVGDAVDEARGYLPGSDADEGPLSDLTASGQALPETFAQEISRNVDVVAQASEQVGQAAAPSVDSGSIGAGGTRPAPRSGGGSGGPTRVVLDLQGLGDDMVDLIRRNADVRVESDNRGKERFVRRQNVRTGNR